jgi:hypothetical protein
MKSPVCKTLGRYYLLGVAFTALHHSAILLESLDVTFSEEGFVQLEFYSLQPYEARRTLFQPPPSLLYQQQEIVNSAPDATTVKIYL